jgi:hypothetical protein
VINVGVPIQLTIVIPVSIEGEPPETSENKLGVYDVVEIASDTQLELVNKALAAAAQSESVTKIIDLLTDVAKYMVVNFPKSEIRFTPYAGVIEETSING